MKAASNRQAPGSLMAGAVEGDGTAERSRPAARRVPALPVDVTTLSVTEICDLAEMFDVHPVDLYRLNLPQSAQHRGQERYIEAEITMREDEGLSTLTAEQRELALGAAYQSAQRLLEMPA